MKKLIMLLSFAILISLNMYAQTPERKYEYAIVHLDEHKKNEIIIYYGKKRQENFAEVKNAKIEDGNLKNTNVVVDALNYMDEKGYELVSTYSVPVVGMGVGFQYVFRKEIKK